MTEVAENFKIVYKEADMTAHGLSYEERFWRKVDAPAEDACWLWTGAKCAKYGAFGFDGRTYKAHRLAYEWLIGPIPDGLTLDHLCMRHACVNPAHLEPVTLLENLHRNKGIKHADRPR